MSPETLVEKKHSYKLFNQIAQTYDFLNHFLSLGMDIYWRKTFVKDLPSSSRSPEGLTVLDLATGTGDLALEMAKNPKVKKVVGLDLSREMLGIGQRKVEKKGLSSKVQLKWGDGVEVPFPDHSFDVVTISYGIRNFSDPLLSLQNIRRVLKPGGKAMIMEFSLPSSSLLKALYLFYFRHILPILGKVLSGHPSAYAYLNQTVETFPYGKDFLELMTRAGFTQVEMRPLTFGITTIYSGRVK